MTGFDFLCCELCCSVGERIGDFQLMSVYHESVYLWGSYSLLRLGDIARCVDFSSAMAPGSAYACWEGEGGMIIMGGELGCVGST